MSSSDLELNKDKFNRDYFVAKVKILFPESYAKMDYLKDNLLHLDMADFARTTVEAIHNKNNELVTRHFDFISELFKNSHPDLENAIYVSYLENVFLGETDDLFLSVRTLLPVNLKNALLGLEDHFNKLDNESE